MIRLRWIAVAALAAAVCMFLAPQLQGQRAATIDVQFTDFDALTPNAHPHDPAFGIDGSLWYTGQRAQTLGRVDMDTGQVREFALPGGTANQAWSRTRSSGSIPSRQRSRSGRSRPVAASSATW
jgi:streptogramin lyase